MIGHWSGNGGAPRGVMVLCATKRKDEPTKQRRARKRDEEEGLGFTRDRDDFN